MQPEERDLAYLWDMREEARLIASFLINISYEKFLKEKVIRYAVERSLMIIGEAANHVSNDFQDAHPEIAWRQIIGQRNILAHEYGDVKADRIWQTATISVPKLLIELEKIQLD